MNTLVPCKFCTNTFSQRRRWQAFCSDRCRNAWHNSAGKEESALQVKLLQEELLEVKAERDAWEAKYYRACKETKSWQRELAGTSHREERPSAYSKAFLREIVDGE
jgi:hypothetical protein